MTIICLNCQTENPVSRTHCSSCGETLDSTVTVQAIAEETHMRNRFDTRDSLDETHLVAELAIDDDLLDEDEVVSDEDITTDEDITYTTTKMPHMDDEDGLLHIGAVRFRGNLLLKDKEHGIEYRLNNNQLKEAIIGRLNARTGFRPQIDFTNDNGKKRGVSRRHATITQRGDLIFVTDHNSLNGTYLNGQRLVPEQARLMRDSDSLRIGHISLIVIFEDDDTDE